MGDENLFDRLGPFFSEEQLSMGTEFPPSVYALKIDVYLCRACGAVVGERLQHVAWHEQFDGTVSE